MSNLQLLCRSCHNKKTKAAMVPAEREVIETVHRPIRWRAIQSPHRQPCDSIEWQHRLWAKGAVQVSEERRTAWSIWLAGPGALPITPAIAVDGFPLHLDPWSWYLGERPRADEDVADNTWLSELPSGITFAIGEPLDEEAAAEQLAVLERRRKFREEWEQRRTAAEKKTVVNSRPFRPPSAGKGKWHTSYADVPKCDMPPWVTNPARSPACGSRTVELDPASEAFYPEVGQRRLDYTDRLCGNCIRIE
jgi:hypothetical protein